MAVEPRNAEISRDQVATWIRTYKRSPDGKGTLEEYIRARVDKLSLDDRMISTVDHQDLDDETDIADMIIADLSSYGVDSDT